MTRPILIDLFCGEGGAAWGYNRAGWEVIGVDIRPQPRYPFAFIQMDCLKVDQRLLALSSAIHASPPCQGMTEMNNDKSRHVNLIPQTRAMLRKSGRPFVIENVRGAREHLIHPVSLFGTMFDDHMHTSKGVRYNLSRERLFETNWNLTPQYDGGGDFPIANVIGGHLRCRDAAHRTGKGTGRTVDFPGEDRPTLARQLMGMPWATMNGMSEAVPPSYTEWIGRQMMRNLIVRETFG